jgi:rhodanese-related sulfurtransferase
MSAYTTISPEKLARLIGLPKSPALIDVRDGEDFSVDPRFIPGSIRRDNASIADWATEFAGASVVVISRGGLKLGHGVAAWLRHAGVVAETLEGGHEAWAKAGLPLIPESKLPPRDAQGRTV